MELIAVINVLEYIENQKLQNNNIEIYTDSQYVVGIERRIPKFKQQNFKTKKREAIKNEDLVRRLVSYIETMNIDFIKVKAHQKKTDKINYNIFVDKLSRKLVKNFVRNNY